MAEKENKTQAALERLKTAVAAFEDSETFKSFLSMQSRFHRYSWRNTILIRVQKPEASYVKGFKGWLDLGRAVRKGEKGIVILAPRTYKTTVEREDGSEEERKGMYFATATVFDVSQTEPIPGHPSPFDPKAALLPEITDERGGSLYDALEAHLRGDEGVDILIYENGQGDGWYQPATKTLAVKSGARLKMLNTLIHEAAHHHARGSDEKFGYGTEEVIVESVAFIVADHFGLDTSLSSVPYVTTWLRRDPKSFEKGMGEIQRLAATLIGAMEVALVEQEELIAA